MALPHVSMNDITNDVALITSKPKIKDNFDKVLVNDQYLEGEININKADIAITKADIETVDDRVDTLFTHVGATGDAHGNATGSNAGFMSSTDKTKLDGIESGATGDMTANEILTAVKTVDGSGSGLDADTLDGTHASDYLTKTNTTEYTPSSNYHPSTKKYVDDSIVAIANETYSSNTTVTQTVTAIPSTAMKSQLDATLKGNTSVNIVTNGNFVNTTGWSGNEASLSASNNTLSITGSGTAPWPATIQATNIPASSGKKIYVSGKIRVTNPNAGYMVMLLRDASFNNIGSITNISSPTENQWYNFTAVYQCQSGLSGNISLWIENIYADAATANGKVMQVKEVMAIDLTAEFGAGNEPSASDCDLRYANWFDGVKGSDKARIKAIGKNLFDKSKAKDTTFVYGANGGTAGGTGFYATDYIPVKGGEYYYFNYRALGSGVAGLAWYDSNKSYISGEVWATNAGGAHQAPSNAMYLRCSPNTASGMTLDNFQIELGTSATTYEAYTETSAIMPAVLHSVPNGTKDTFNANTGLFTDNVKEYTITADDITTLDLEATGVDLVSTRAFTDNKAWTSNSIDRAIIVEGMQEVNDYSLVGEEGNFVVDVVQKIYFIVAKGTYADLATAKSALAGTKIYYQLATPLQYQYLPHVLTAEPYGQVVVEPFIQDVGLYTTAITIEDSDYPVSSLDYVNLIDIETGMLTPISLSSCTVAADGLSFTISSASSGEYYDYGYTYAGLSTIHTLNYSYATNLKGQVNSNAKQIALLDDKIETVIDSVGILNGTSMSDILTAPNGVSTDISSTNLNTITKTGFYRGNNLTNAPDAGWWYVLVESNNDDGNILSGYTKQTITAYGTNMTGGTTYIRVRTNSTTWGAWAKLGTLDEAQTITEADTLDGYHATAFSLTNHNHTGTYEPVVTKGNLTEATSSVLTISGGTGAVIGSGTTVQVKQASGSQSGYLSSTDWTTFNNKQATITGGASTIASSNLATSMALVSDGSGKVATHGTVSSTELGYLDGVTSAIQTQIDSKLATSSYTASDVLTKIKTVDGTGSGLDADTLDGLHASSFFSAEVMTTTGDMIYASAPSTPARLPFTANSLLKTSGTTPEWLAVDTTSGKILHTNGNGDLVWEFPQGGGVYSLSNTTIMSLLTERSQYFNGTYSMRSFTIKFGGRVRIVIDAKQSGGSANILLKDSSGNTISTSYTVTTDYQTFTIEPNTDLIAGATYYITGLSNGVTFYVRNMYVKGTLSAVTVPANTIS